MRQHAHLMIVQTRSFGVTSWRLVLWGAECGLACLGSRRLIRYGGQERKEMSWETRWGCTASVGMCVGITSPTTLSYSSRHITPNTEKKNPNKQTGYLSPNSTSILYHPTINKHPPPPTENPSAPPSYTSNTAIPPLSNRVPENSS